MDDAVSQRNDVTEATSLLQQSVALCHFCVFLFLFVLLLFPERSPRFELTSHIAQHFLFRKLAMV